MDKWKIILYDGYSTYEIHRNGTYDYVSNSCAGYPPGYIWAIVPANQVLTV
jgi:hypothetical protein